MFAVYFAPGWEVWIFGPCPTGMASAVWGLCSKSFLSRCRGLSDRASLRAGLRKCRRGEPDNWAFCAPPLRGFKAVSWKRLSEQPESAKRKRQLLRPCKRIPRVPEIRPLRRRGQSTLCGAPQKRGARCAPSQSPLGWLKSAPFSFGGHRGQLAEAATFLKMGEVSQSVSLSQHETLLAAILG